LSLEKLLNEWVSADADLRDAQLARHDIEQQIIEAMNEVDAELSPTVAGVTATLKTQAEYDKTLAGPLRVIAEALSPDEIEGLLTPVKPPPARSFNMTKVKTLSKRGEPFKSAIEAATIATVPKLKIAYEK